MAEPTLEDWMEAAKRVVALKLSEDKKALGAQGAPLPPTTDELRPGSVTEPPHRCDLASCPGHRSKSASCIRYPDGSSYIPITGYCFNKNCPGHVAGERCEELPPLEQHCFVNCLCCGAYLEFWFLPGNIVLHCVQRLGSPLQVMASVGMKDDLIHCWRCANKFLIYYSLNPTPTKDEAQEDKDSMAEEGVPAPPKLPDR